MVRWRDCTTQLPMERDYTFVVDDWIHWSGNYKLECVIDTGQSRLRPLTKGFRDLEALWSGYYGTRGMFQSGRHLGIFMTVGWDPEKQQAILTDPNTGFSTRLSGTIDDSGTMYAPYNQLGSIFAGAATKTRPLTAQDYTQSFDTAKAMWDPLIQPYMESLQEKSRGQMAAIEGLRLGWRYSQALPGRQEDKARGVVDSAIERVYSSGLYDEMQKGITALCPEYQQRINKAAGLAALSGNRRF